MLFAKLNIIFAFDCQALDKNSLGPLRKSYCLSLNLLLRREVSLQPRRLCLLCATYRFFRFEESLNPASWYKDRLPQDAL